jgi:hypothetical protein
MSDYLHRMQHWNRRDQEHGERLVLLDMIHERENELKLALDAIAGVPFDGPLYPSPAFVALINLPAELALLRAALS